MSLAPQIKALSREWGPRVQGGELDGRAVLEALADVESSYGAQAIPIFEPAYAGPGPQPARQEGGYYWQRAAHVKKAWARWGDYAACSYSPWHLLYVTALEMGLPVETDPAALRSPSMAIPWVVRILNRRVFQRRPGEEGSLSFAQVLDAWNTGSHRDHRLPSAAYVAKGVRAYQRRRAEGAV